MPTYYYTIKNNQGDLKKGKVQAANESEAADVVKLKDYYILELKEGKRQKQKLSSFERINFTDHLASAVESGVSLRDALEAYADEEGKRMVMIDSMIKTIEQGKKISQAFAEFPEAFSKLYISLLKSGETIGNLGETLGFLANELRRDYYFKQKVRSALFYPILVIGVAVMVMGMVMTYVVPKIAEITENLGAKLPLPTRILLNTSKSLSHVTPVSLIFGIAVIGLIFWLIKRSNLGPKFSAMTLNLPGIGNILKKYTLYRFLKVLSNSIKYGIPLPEAFVSTEEVMGFEVYRQACRQMNQAVQKGQSLSVAIAAQGRKLFPSLVVRTVRGSEKTGRLDSAMSRLATQYEMEVDRDLRRMTELMEPIIVILLGLMVLGIATSVIAPIYQLTSQIK